MLTRKKGSDSGEPVSFGTIGGTTEGDVSKLLALLIKLAESSPAPLRLAQPTQEDAPPTSSTSSPPAKSTKSRSPRRKKKG